MYEICIKAKILEHSEEKLVDNFIASCETFMVDCFFSGIGTLSLWIVHPLVYLFVAIRKFNMWIVTNFFSQTSGNFVLVIF